MPGSPNGAVYEHDAIADETLDNLLISGDGYLGMIVNTDEVRLRPRAGDELDRTASDRTPRPAVRWWPRVAVSISRASGSAGCSRRPAG